MIDRNSEAIKQIGKFQEFKEDGKRKLKHPWEKKLERILSISYKN